MRDGVEDLTQLAKRHLAPGEYHETSIDKLPFPRGSRDRRVVYVVAVSFSLFQVWTSAFNPLSTMVIRSIHVGFLVFLAYLVFRASRNAAGGRIPWYDWGLGGLGFAAGFYHWIFEHELIVRAGDPNTFDIAVGLLVTVLVFEATRRVSGWSLPLLCLGFLSWLAFGHLLMAPFNHRGYGFDQIIGQLFIDTEGLYGSATFVSATYIFLFILFASFMKQAGLLDLFNDIALGLVGRFRGGPAQVCSLSSALMGTVTGSGIANVVASGQFTIPLMIRFGFRPVFAGAVEATSSMGGQILPPIMGAGAFLMAETIGISYAEVAKAALIPAILYFAAISWMIFLEAQRHDLSGMPKDACPSALRAVIDRWHLLIPLMVLVWLMFAGFTPLFAGTMGMLGTTVIILGLPLAGRIGPTAVRIVFWVFLGFACAGLLHFGAWTVFAAIGLLIVTNLFLRSGRETLRQCLDSLAEGALNAVPVGITCVIVGTVDATFNLTGVGITLVNAITAVADTSLFLSLVLVMLMCLVLGLGLPTIPSYVICATVAVPALLHLGVPVLAGHMFVFYFGIMAQLTPPVALAAFAAAPFANESPMKIGWVATYLAVAGFLVPFVAVYSPEILLINPAPWPLVEAICRVVAVVGLWGIAMAGYLFTSLPWSARLMAGIAALLMTGAVPWGEPVGLAVGGTVIGMNALLGNRRKRQHAFRHETMFASPEPEAVTREP